MRNIQPVIDAARDLVKKMRYFPDDYAMSFDISGLEAALANLEPAFPTAPLTPDQQVRHDMSRPPEELPP